MRNAESSEVHGSGSVLQYHDIIWDNDDALLHFDPGEGILLPSEHKKLPSGREIPVATEFIDGRHKRRSNERRTRKTKQKPTVESVEVNGIDLEKVITGNILNRSALHLRILRYEPIAFDVFLKFITVTESESRRLHAELRAVLDGLGICFYGEQPFRKR